MSAPVFTDDDLISPAGLAFLTALADDMPREVTVLNVTMTRTGTRLLLEVPPRTDDSFDDDPAGDWPALDDG